MNQKRMMDQVTAVFGIFMTAFYIGVGIYMAFYAKLNIENAIKNLVAYPFILFGIYRGFRTWQKIRDLFFRKPDYENEE
jgi:ABC-type phosphate transport system permease subunit